MQGMTDPDEYLVSKPLLDNSRFVPIVEKRKRKKDKLLKAKKNK